MVTRHHRSDSPQANTTLAISFPADIRVTLKNAANLKPLGIEQHGECLNINDIGQC